MYENVVMTYDGRLLFDRRKKVPRTTSMLWPISIQDATHETVEETVSRVTDLIHRGHFVRITELGLRKMSARLIKRDVTRLRLEPRKTSASPI